MLAAAIFAQQAQQQLPDSPKPQAQPPQTSTQTQHLRSGPTDYSKGASVLTIVGPYKAKLVPPPVLKNTPRIEQLMRDGKLLLSLNDAIALALENNLDLAIARYNNDIADTDLLRVQSGAPARGVNTGLVANTPGGTGATNVGGGAGGTSTGAGGAGAGAGGIVSSTLGAGPPIDSFDPILTGTFQIEHLRQEQTSTFITGTNFLTQNNGIADLAYSQGFQTGTLLNVGFNNTRSTTNNLRSNLEPALNSNFRATIRQHLLSGCCLFVNRRNIISARYNKQIADIAFENQVIFTVTQIQDIYWDLVNAYQNLLVKQRSVALAEKTLSDNKKQVEIGTLAPIEVVRAQSAVASSQQDLIVAQTNLQLQQLLMKNAITRNLSDPTLATAPVIPTDTMVVSADELLQLRPVDELVNDALKRRPDINSQRIDLKNRDISRKATRNSLKPALDLIGFYGGAGLGGNFQTCDPTTAICTPTGITRGYGGVLADMFNSTNPDKGMAFQLNIPIRNRTAQADQVRSELEYRQAELRVHQLESQINIEVRNAQYSVQQNKAAVDAAKAARELAQQSLDAEQKKYALGASTNTLVLQAQRDLTQAEVNFVTSLTNYEKARVTLDQATGYTLDRLGIVLSDAATGQVSALPRVPGVVNASSPEGQQQAPLPPQQQQQQQQQQQPPPQNPQ
jgi:outer membrane protein TolC